MPSFLPSHGSAHSQLVVTSRAHVRRKPRAYPAAGTAQQFAAPDMPCQPPLPALCLPPAQRQSQGREKGSAHPPPSSWGHPVLSQARHSGREAGREGKKGGVAVWHKGTSRSWFQDSLLLSSAAGYVWQRICNTEFYASKIHTTTSTTEWHNARSRRFTFSAVQVGGAKYV